jgi:type IV pilus assembly protein PilB
MRISDSLVLDLLKESHKVNAEQLRTLQDQQRTQRKTLQDVVLQNNTLSEKELTQLYAAKIEVPFVEINPKMLRRDVLSLIPEHIARQYISVLFDVKADGAKLLAMEDPDDVQAFNFLQKQLGSNIHVFIATRSNILAALDQYRSNIGSELTQVIASEDTPVVAEEEVSEEEVAEDSPVARTVNLLIEYAIKQGASDIHIEPREDYVSIRYRVDGQLRETNKLPKKSWPPLSAVLKF